MKCVVVRKIGVAIFDNIELIYKDIKDEYPFLTVRQGERKASVLCDSVEDLDELYDSIIAQLKEGIETLVIEEKVDR